MYYIRVALFLAYVPHWIFFQNSKFFIEENALEIVV